MNVASLCIENFRGIRRADLRFHGHTLFIGGNNVGKSTICEALDLVLGPDRLNRFPPVEEFDFYNGAYLQEDGQTAIPIRIEVVLTNLTDDVSRVCGAHLEYWHKEEMRLLGTGEIDAVDQAQVQHCLRLETRAQYNPEEDEFEANTFFSHSPDAREGELVSVRKATKRLFGFIYLRTLRTGSRALSLERGSLLDLILRLQGIRTGLWERTRKRLRELDPPIEADAGDIGAVLKSIEGRLAEYIPVQGKGSATRLFVSQLTREHLRKTVAFFLSLSPDQEPVPFQEAGTGTINTLVLALLSVIAEIKKENVIFAMEEPEIALPPHTQRRIANYLLDRTTQCFVTSHSPYIVERFEPEQILVLRRDGAANLSAAQVAQASGLKEKIYKKYTRRGLAEAMLGRGVIVAEGITEQSTLMAVAQIMEEADASLFPLDLSGVTVFSVDGDGSLPPFGEFFRSLGLRTFAFYDKKNRKADEVAKFAQNFDINNETEYAGMEMLMATEIPVDRQWEFLSDLRASERQGNVGIPEVRPDEPRIRELTRMTLQGNKGGGLSAELVARCPVGELPASIRSFLELIYAEFPRPATETPVAPEMHEAAAPGVGALIAAVKHTAAGLAAEADTFIVSDEFPNPGDDAASPGAVG